MTLDEFDRLLREVRWRLRLGRSARLAFAPAAAALAGLGLAVLASKLAPAEHPWMVAGVAALLAAIVIGCAFAAAWLRRPVSELAAAAEVDRVCGLRERAGSLVAIRSGAAPRTALFPAIEADAAVALSGLEREAVLRAALPALPGRARWIVGLSAAALAALLVPARAPREEPGLAGLLAGGPEAVRVARSAGAAEAGSPDAAGRRKTANKVLVLLQGPPPADGAAAAKKKQDLLELATQLRRSESPSDRALARQLEDLAAQIARLAGAPLPEASPGRHAAGIGGDDGSGRAAYLRSHPEYAELLARYFSGGG